MLSYLASYYLPKSNSWWRSEFNTLYTSRNYSSAETASRTRIGHCCKAFKDGNRRAVAERFTLAVVGKLIQRKVRSSTKSTSVRLSSPVGGVPIDGNIWSLWFRRKINQYWLLTVHFPAVPTKMPHLNLTSMAECFSPFRTNSSTLVLLPAGISGCHIFSITSRPCGWR